MQQPLTCQELVELITDYLEGALPTDERARFEQHLGRCTGCSNYLEQMRISIRLAGKLGEETLHPHIRNEMLDIFRDWKQQ